MLYETKKLFNGFASVRDYVIEKAIKDREDLVVRFKGLEMKVPLDRLKSKWGLHTKQFKSKYGTGSYILYDFKFKADEQTTQTLFD